MKNLFFFLAIVILVTLELNWPVFLNFFYCRPDLLLVFMVALVFYTDFKTALIFGILAGLAKDVFLPGPLPANTICFGIWSYLAWRLSRQISTEEYFLPFAVVLAVALSHNFIIGALSAAGGNNLAAGIFLRNLIIGSAYSTLLAPGIFKLTKKIAL